MYSNVFNSDFANEDQALPNQYELGKRPAGWLANLYYMH